MSYDIAINKAWGDLARLGPPQNLSVKFLADEFSVDVEQKKVISLSCNVPAKDFSAILILHYLIQKLKGLPLIKEEWLTFRELAGIEGYAEAFRKRAIEPIIRKYGSDPQGLFSVSARLGAKKTEGGDAAIVLDAFSGVPVLVKAWKADAEFSADANIFFDRSITEIFCIEDIVVLAGIVASQL